MISNRALQGQPSLPYTDNIVWAGQDIFVDMTFLDHTGQPVVPTSVSLEIDDLTNSVAMLGPISLAPAGEASPVFSPAFATQMLVQIPASVMVMTFPYEGSQICQFKWTFTALDLTNGRPFQADKVDIVSLCAISTVSGQ